MKLYLVERTDKIDYDEYDSYVVRANNVEDALKLCQNKEFKDECFRIDNTEITEILLEGKEEIIIGSFNAG